MKWYVYVAEYKTGNHVITQCFKTEKEAEDAYYRWNRSLFDVKIYEWN